MFTLRSAMVSAVMGAGLVVGVAGCHHDADDRAMRHDSSMSMKHDPKMMDHDMSMDTTGMNKMQVMHKGEKMMNTGEDMKRKAMHMSDSETVDGMSKQQMMDHGNMMMKNGQMLKDKAKGM